MEEIWLPRYFNIVNCKAGCTKSSDHRFYRSPKNESRYKIWADIAGIPFESGDKRKTFYLCGRHFHRNQFKNSLRINIICRAVPTITREQWEKDNEPAVGVDLQSNSDHDSLLRNAGNSDDLTIDNTMEKTSCPMKPTSMSGDVTAGSSKNAQNVSPIIIPSATGNEQKSDQKTDYQVENIPSPSSDTDHSDHILENMDGEKISEEESVSAEKTVPPLNDYYRYTLCRLCFCSSKDLISIFKESQKYGCMISDAIKDLLQFEVSKADDYPQFICFECLEMLMKFKKYKDKLCALRIEFGESLQKLREKGHEVIVCGQSDHPMDEEEVAQNVDCRKVVNELKEMTDNCSSEDSEDVSDVEEPFSDFENMERQDLSEPETGDKISYVKEVSLEEEYKCSECGEVFQFKNLLTKHIVEHRKTWPFPCRYCDKRFKTLMHLNGHIVMHSSYKPYECEHCGLRSRTKSSLAAHKKTHSNEKPFLCYVCGMVFRNRSLLTTHLRIHSGVNCYKCEECGAQFPSSRKLARHLSTHSRVKNHVCGDCGKSFRLSRSLIEHIARVHQMQKNYQCVVCSKKFSVKRALSEHMKTHLNQMVPSDSILILT